MENNQIEEITDVINESKPNVSEVDRIKNQLNEAITAEEKQCLDEVSEVLKKHGCKIVPFIKAGFDPYVAPKWGYQFVSDKRQK